MATAINVNGYDNISENIEEDDEIKISTALTNFLISLRLFWWIVVLLTAFGLLAGFLYGKFFYTLKYDTSASFTVASGKNGDSDYGFRSSLDDQLINSEVYIMQSNTLKNMLVESLGENYADCEITADALSSTNVVTLKVSADSQHKAYVAIQQIISDFPKISQRIYGDVNVSLLDQVEVSDEASNATNQKMLAVYGALAGLVLALAGVFVYSLNLHLVPDAETLRKYGNAECTGELPSVKSALNQKNKKGVHALINNRNTPDEFKEAYQFIRTRTERSCRKNNSKSVVITSTFPGEGKTTVAVNLALSLAQNGKSVYLIDGDLRNPSVLNALGVTPPKKGLEEYLHDKCEIEETQTTVPHTNITISACITGMEDAHKKLADSSMEKLVDFAKENYDYVIIDSPPTDVMGDSVTICNKYVDSALFVVRQNYGKLNNVIYALDSIRQTKADLIGFVLNGISGGK